VLDLGRDRKGYDCVTLADTRRDLFALLRRQLLPGLADGSLRLAFASRGVSMQVARMASEPSLGGKTAKRKGGLGPAGAAKVVPAGPPKKKRKTGGA